MATYRYVCVCVYVSPCACMPLRTYARPSVFPCVRISMRFHVHEYIYMFSTITYFFPYAL